MSPHPMAVATNNTSLLQFGGAYGDSAGGNHLNLNAACGGRSVESHSTVNSDHGPTATALVDHLYSEGLQYQEHPLYNASAIATGHGGDMSGSLPSLRTSLSPSPTMQGMIANATKADQDLLDVMLGGFLGDFDDVDYWNSGGMSTAQ